MENENNKKTFDMKRFMTELLFAITFNVIFITAAFCYPNETAFVSGLFIFCEFFGITKIQKMIYDETAMSTLDTQRIMCRKLANEAVVEHNKRAARVINND